MIEMKDDWIPIDDDWTPTESDCQWLITILNSIKIGGQWRTGYAIYERSGEKTLTLIAKVFVPYNKAEDNIARTKRAVQAIGWTYVESNELLNCIVPFAPTALMRDGKDLLAYVDGNPVHMRLQKCGHCGFWYTADGKKCPQCKTERK
jgi:hypothetical protein